MAAAAVQQNFFMISNSLMRLFFVNFDLGKVPEARNIFIREAHFLGLFQQADVTLPGGRHLRIEAPDNGPDRPYVHAIRLDGRTLSAPFLDIATLKKGGRLVFEMDDKPE